MWKKIKKALYEPEEVGVCVLAYEPFVRRYEFKVLAHKFVGVVDRECVLVGEAGLAVKCDVEYKERDLAVVARKLMLHVSWNPYYPSFGDEIAAALSLDVERTGKRVDDLVLIMAMGNKVYLFPSGSLYKNFVFLRTIYKGDVFTLLSVHYGGAKG